MKVICAGFPKTGTKSMHAAFKTLGYSVHDYPDALKNFEIEYEDIRDKGWKTIDFYGMYKNVDTIVDGPGFYLWEELLQAFPEAKVILTIRNDDEIWYKSIRDQVLMNNGYYMLFYSLLSPSWRRFWRYLDNIVWMCFGMEENTGFVTGYSAPPNITFKQAYRRHNAYVMNRCPKDRLLLFHCRDGWKPLCEFLGKRVPDRSFPTANKSGEVVKSFWQLDILEQAKNEVRIKIGVFALTLVITCYTACKKLPFY